MIFRNTRMAIKVLKQLLHPIGYLWIKTRHGEKRLVDWVFPTMAALTVTSIWAVWPGLIPLRGTEGVVTGIGSIMQVLVGFYVAALAAVATFPSPALDQEAIGMSRAGQPIKRRVFLAALFGYLAFLGLCLLVMSLFKKLPTALALETAQLARYAVHALLFLHQLVFWQMVFITLLGLYYLTDRIHRSEAG